MPPMRCLIFLFLSVPLFAQAANLIVIPNGAPETSRLEGHFEKALGLFELELGDISEDLVVEIAPKRCLRTGYNRKSRTVVFCPNSRTINAGLESPDVIHHEFFHALLCLKHPPLCDGDDREDVHEALADVFAFRLLPDPNFGEGYYHEYPYVRTYSTSFRPELVFTPHERGMALASKFISEGWSFRKMLMSFEEDLTPAVSVAVVGIEPSKLNRYRLPEGLDVRLFFKTALDLDVRWESVPGVEIRESGRLSFIFRNTDLKASHKIRARFFEKGVEVGGMNFYVGPEL